MRFSHYYGHIYMWLAIFFGLTGPVALIYIFGFYPEDRTQWGAVLLFLFGCGAVIAAAVFAAMAYVWWTPKWQRNEARGRSLYDASKPSVLTETPMEQIAARTEAQGAREEGNSWSLE